MVSMMLEQAPLGQREGLLRSRETAPAMDVDLLDHDGGVVVVLLENSRVRNAQVPRTCAEGLVLLKRRWKWIRELCWCRPKAGTL